WVIRRIINVRSRNHYLGWIFGFLWTIGWISAVLFAVSISSDFRRYKDIETPVAISQPANDKMLVVGSEPELRYTGRFDWMNDDSEGWDLTDDSLKLSIVRFDIKKSDDSLYHVALRRYSYGRTDEEAVQRAERIRYAVHSADSVLDLASGYAIGKENKFRWQE